MTMSASARRVGGGLECEVDVNRRHTITTDEPERLGGTDRGPAPHELLPAMLASCVTTMVAAYAQSRGWNVDGISTDVSYDTDTTPRRVLVELHLPGSLSADQRRRLERVAASCPARRALEAGFSFEERTTAGGAPAVAA